MLITVSHVTRYSYDEPVHYTVQSLRLTPAPFKGQRIVNWQVRVPGCAKSAAVQGRVRQCRGPRHRPRPPQRAGDRGRRHGRNQRLQRRGGRSCQVHPAPRLPEGNASRHARTPPSATWPNPSSEKDPLDRLHALAGSVRDRIDYVAGITDAHTGAAAALADGKGVCQDHAHIFISAARTLGIPARYITGYLLMDDAATRRCAPRLGGGLDRPARLGRLRHRQPGLPHRSLRAPRRRPRRRLRRPHHRLAPGRGKREARSVRRRAAAERAAVRRVPQ